MRTVLIAMRQAIGQAISGTHPVLLASITLAIVATLIGATLYTQHEMIAIEDLVTASDAGRVGAQIQRLRIQTSAVGYTLNGIAAALSLTMLTIAFRIARRNERLALAHSRAIEERSELEAFAARVAHDIKNPIAAIALQLNALKRP